jgi:outer membrane cobalamin receptor
VRAVAQVDLTPALRLKLRLENAFDARHELVDGYNTSGRAAFAGFAWRM